MLLWHRFSNLSGFFRSDFFCFPSSPQPLFLLGWLLNGGSALPPTTATTTAVRWQGPLLLVSGRVPNGRYLPSTNERHCSAEHTPRLGFWSLLLVAGHAPHRRHLPSTCGRHCASENTPRPAFWSHQFPARWQSKPLRSGTAQAPPIRLVCSALCQHVAQHISANCQHKHQDRTSTCTFFAIRGSEAYARHATDKHTGINSRMTFDVDFAC